VLKQANIALYHVGERQPFFKNWRIISNTISQIISHCCAEMFKYVKDIHKIFILCHWVHTEIFCACPFVQAHFQHYNFKIMC